MLIDAGVAGDPDGADRAVAGAGGDTDPRVEASVGPVEASRVGRQIPGDRTRLRTADHAAGGVSARRSSPPRALGPQVPAGRTWSERRGRALVAVAAVGVLNVGPAAADPAPRTLRAASDLDGLHLWLGPVGAATRVEGDWDSAWGGTVAVVRVRERAPLAAAGLWLGGARYAARDGGRLWLDGIAGTRRLGGRMLGVGVGPVLELGELRHLRPGAQASIWCFAGVVPYARVGVLEASGPFVELGLSLSVPALRW